MVLRITMVSTSNSLEITLSRFSGARSFKDLDTIVHVSQLINVSTDGQPTRWYTESDGVSKRLFVTILAALYFSKSNNSKDVLLCTFYLAFIIIEISLAGIILSHY